MVKIKWMRNMTFIVVASSVALSLGNGFGVTEVLAVKKEKTTEVSQLRQVEDLDRGAIAVKVWNNGVYLSWRYLGTDSENTTFTIYRDGQLITAEAISNSTNYSDKKGTANSVYEIHTLVNEVEVEVTDSITVMNNSHLDIPIQKPESRVTPTGVSYDYTANDCSCADLDGDGEYEIILKWMPTNAGDNMADGYRGNTYIDAYKLDGTRLWRIDLGVNIRSGPHYTQFMVYDFDGDGYGEMVCKTGDGTVDGLGNVIGDGDKDWRTSAGTIMDGPEYLTLFDGFTGEALDTIDYYPSRDPYGKIGEQGKTGADAEYWGDGYGNRSERYLGAVAYLDGKTPSVVMSRGYYHNFGIVAYDVVDKKLVERWTFNTAEGYEDYVGQGNHNLAVADVDGDGCDEIVFGACTIDHDGTGLYVSKELNEDTGEMEGLGHGDAIHVGDFDLTNEGLEIWSCFEHSGGAALRDAKTGEILYRWRKGPWDTGRCSVGNFIPDINYKDDLKAVHDGAEFAASGSSLMDEEGNVVLKKDSTEVGWPFKWTMSSVIYWNGTLEQENLDRNIVESYTDGRLFTGSNYGVGYINGTKGNACLSADILGDWREEMIFPTYDNSTLRIFTTTIPTEYRIATLMHDTQYRCQIASQNVGYNQPAHTSFYLGTGHALPEQPNVVAAKASEIKIK